MTEMLIWKDAEAVADTTTHERHLSLVSEVRIPTTVEFHELALIANAYRDKMVALQVVENRTRVLSTTPNDLQAQGRELAGKIPRVK